MYSSTVTEYLYLLTPYPLELPTLRNLLPFNYYSVDVSALSFHLFKIHSKVTE